MAGRSAIKAGDQVAFLNEAGGGTVLRLLGHDRCVVRTGDGFELEAAMGELVRVDTAVDEVLYGLTDEQLRDVAANDRRDERMASDRERGGSLRKAKSGDRRADAGTMEVDLHLHEIVEDERGLSDGEKLNEQLRYFERMLNTAIRERKQRMIVIHGVGEGRLREEVRKLLGYYDLVRFDDADPRRYGYGATEVTILRH